MSETITVGRRGSITIPAKLRRAFGMQQNDQLIAEQTPDGILLKPSVSIPVEIANVWVNAFDFEEIIPDMPRQDSLRFAAAVGLTLLK